MNGGAVVKEMVQNSVPKDSGTMPIVSWGKNWDLKLLYPARSMKVTNRNFQLCRNSESNYYEFIKKKKKSGQKIQESKNESYF